MPRPRISDAEYDARRKDRRDPHQCEGPVEEWCFHCRHMKAYRDGLKRKPEPGGEMMAEAKHTPGPWHVGMEMVALEQGWKRKLIKEESPRVLKDRGNFPPMFVAVPCLGDGIGNEQQAANAHLIAAAPDLLRELKRFVAELPSGLIPDSARAAIAKAESA